jgi:hypothetical protein
MRQHFRDFGKYPVLYFDPSQAVCGNCVNLPQRFCSAGLPTVLIDVTTEDRNSESGIPYVVALLILGHELHDGFKISVSNSVFVLIEFGHYSSMKPFPNSQHPLVSLAAQDVQVGWVLTCWS